MHHSEQVAFEEQLNLLENGNKLLQILLINILM